MILSLKRTVYTANSTIGELSVNGSFFCYTLEDRVRADGIKVLGETCIPERTYPVVIDYSPNHGRDLPHILNVPMFTGIRIHPGNTAIDTEGCVLLGLQEAPDMVTQSKQAFNMFFPLLEMALAHGSQATITILHEVIIPPELLLEA